MTKTQELLSRYKAALNDPRSTHEPDDLTDIANDVTVALRSAKGADVGALYSLLADVRRHQNRRDEALQQARRALKEDEQSPSFANGVSRAHGELGHHDEALRFAEMADRLLQRRPDPRLEVVVVLNRLVASIGTERLGADALVRRAMALVDRVPESYLRAARSLAAAGRWTEAVECGARHVARELGVPRGTQSLRELLAEAPEALVESVRSYPSLAAVIDDAPQWLDMPEPLASLVAEAQRCVDEGRQDDAHRALRRVVAAAGTNVPALRALSSMMARLGHENDTVEFLARAMGVATGKPRAKRLAIQVALDDPEWTARMVPDDAVTAALVAVRNRHGAPMPAHLAVSAEIELSEEGWRRFVELVAP